MPTCQKKHIVIVEYGKPIYPNELDKEQKKKNRSLLSGCDC